MLFKVLLLQLLLHAKNVTKIPSISGLKKQVIKKEPNLPSFVGFCFFFGINLVILKAKLDGFTVLMSFKLLE